MFLTDEHTQACAGEALDSLDSLLGREFSSVFPLLLSDRGHELQDFGGIERGGRSRLCTNFVNRPAELRKDDTPLSPLRQRASSASSATHQLATVGLSEKLLCVPDVFGQETSRDCDHDRERDGVQGRIHQNRDAKQMAKFEEGGESQHER